MFSEGCHPIHSLAALILLGLVGWDDLHTYVVRELSLSAGERGCVRVAQVVTVSRDREARVRTQVDRNLETRRERESLERKHGNL